MEQGLRSTQIRLGHGKPHHSSLKSCYRKHVRLTVQQLPPVEVFPLRAGGEGAEEGGPRGAHPQPLLQLLVELQLFEGGVLLDAVLQLSSQTPHFAQQFAQLQREIRELAQVPWRENNSNLDGVSEWTCLYCCACCDLEGLITVKVDFILFHVILTTATRRK